VSPLARLFALAGLVSLDTRIMVPVLPAISASLGVAPGEVGYAVTAYTLVYGSMQVVYGPLSDRLGRVRVIRATGLLFALGTGLSALASSTWELVGARLVTGMFAAATIPTTFAYIGDTVPYASRHAVIGRFGAVMSTAQALSAALAGAITHVVSWRVMFAAYAALAVLPVAALFGVRDATRPVTAAGARVGYAAILARPAARRVYLAAASEGFFIWGGTTYLGVLASGRFGFNDLEIGLLIACYGLGTVAGGVTFARLADAIGERRAASRGGLVLGTGWLALVPPLPWPVFALALAVVGLGFGWLHAILQTRATELMPEARAKAFTLFPLSVFFGGALGTAALGRLVDLGLLPLVAAVCAVGLASVGQFAGRRR